MREVIEVEAKIMEIFKSSCCEYNINDFQADLFNSSCQVAPRDLLYVFMELTKTYPEIDFNKIISSIKIFTIHSIANELCKQTM